MNLTNDRTGALTARDWPALAKLSQRFLSMCRNTANPDQLGLAYVNLATAQVNQGQVDKYLATTTACIEASYQATGCHVHRARALRQLGRKQEALAELDRTDRLIALRMQDTKQLLGGALAPSHRNLEESRLAGLEAQADLASAVRESLEQ